MHPVNKIASLVGLRLSRTKRGMRLSRLTRKKSATSFSFSLKDKMIWQVGPDEVEKTLTLAVQYAYLADVAGDIAEFGTQSGRTARAIASALARTSSSKKLYLFDSFEGLPIAEAPEDQVHPFVISGGWNPGNLKGLTVCELRKFVGRSGLPVDKIVVYPGWFRDTLPMLPPDTKFSMLHIDCDLYQSTMDVLDVCFSNRFVSAGAIILFDDWNMAKASNELGERRAWQDLVKKYSIDYDDEGGYSWNAHKFIVHSYNITPSE